MTQLVMGESLLEGMQEKNQGQLEGDMHLDHLVRTSHFLLLVDFLDKARLDKAQWELQVLKEMVQLGMVRGLQVAVLELLQVGTAQDTALGLQGWRGTALALLVQGDIVQVIQDQEETHQALKEVQDMVLGLQDQTEMGTAQEPLDQMILQSRPEQRAGWELLGLNQAILGLRGVEGCWQGQTG